MGRQRYFPTSSTVERTPVDHGWLMRKTIDKYLPETLVVVVDVYSNADDLYIVRALDENGVDVLADMQLQGSLAAGAEERIAVAMTHDIALWLRLNRFEYGSPYRAWMWIRPDEIVPVSPLSQYVYHEKA